MAMALMFDRDILGNVGGFPVVDLLGTSLIAYALSVRLNTPLLPTIAGAFAAREMGAWALGMNTPLLEKSGIVFFPAPEQGRHLNRRACNCTQA